MCSVASEPACNKDDSTLHIFKKRYEAKEFSEISLNE